VEWLKCRPWVQAPVQQKKRNSQIKMVNFWRDFKNYLIWLLHILYMYRITILLPIKMYKYVSIFKKSKKKKQLKV
jgi:hypothetical protein